jgi:type III secretion protein U
VIPQWSRINPGAGFKRLFGARQWVDLLKALVIAAVVLAVIWTSVRKGGPEVFRLTRLEGAAALRVILHLLAAAAWRAGCVLLVLGALDYLWARRRHLKDLMMTRQERKEDHKNAEGNPQHKGRRKALHRQLLAGGTARGVQKATCIVVNPTHIAVALRYDQTEADAPYIVAKGCEEDALKMRKQAKEQGIPVVKDIPLARSLVHYDVGEEIPEELYKAAAAVLKVALEAREKDAHPARRT